MRKAMGVVRALALASGIGLAGGAMAADTIIYGMVSKLAIQWPVWVALDKGWYDRAGIKLDIVVSGGSAKSALMLAAGSANIGDGGLPDMLRPIDQGAPVKIIGYEVAQPPYKLLARRDIKSLAALKGKKVIIGGSRDITLIYLEAMVRPAGLKPTDFELLYAGATSARFAALSAGGVDAAILSSPFDFQALDQGYTNLGSAHKVLPDFPFSGFAANSTWANAHRDAVVSFLRIFQQGIEWLYDPKNKAEAATILAKATATPLEDAVKTYDLFFGELHAFRRDGTMPAASFNRLLNAVAELGDLPKPPPAMAKFIDDSFLKAALAGR